MEDEKNNKPLVIEPKSKLEPMSKENSLFRDKDCTSLIIVYHVISLKLEIESY